MSARQRIQLATKSLRWLGSGPISQFIWYQLALFSGVYRLATPPRRAARAGVRTCPPLALNWVPLPSQEELQDIIRENASVLLAEAQDIQAGKIRLFGGPPVELRLSPTPPLHHWTKYARSGMLPDKSDIKFTWEPARFGWACILARAYRFTRDESYAETFWQLTEQFLRANPTNLGPNWASAQEVAIRLITLVFACRVFFQSEASTPERKSSLAQAIADHAARIPPTLMYARAQRNNHLLTEAAGLCTAALCLPDHPSATRWWDTGWRILNSGLQDQIAADGTYIQHSANYHRLMLQAALWIAASGVSFPAETRSKLSAATRWLHAIADPSTGRVPNLGHNDGAYILPLAICPIHDFRPVLQAAGLAFLEQQFYPPGAWDEMALWLRFRTSSSSNGGEFSNDNHLALHQGKSLSPLVIRSRRGESWAYLRTAHYSSRPAHADQLHLDIWWLGHNLAMDGGTYLYNAPEPWDNSLARTAIHNTITIENSDQMTRAGRFLWLDWAQARILATESNSDGLLVRAAAAHDGYHRLGVTHQRTVSLLEGGGWLVEDLLKPKGTHSLSAMWPIHEKPLRQKQFDIRLHWLMPDWHWEMGDTRSDARAIINLRSLHGWVKLEITAVPQPQTPLQPLLVRAGEIQWGTGPAHPTWGWVSHIYGQKTPALSYSINIRAQLPITLISRWIIPEGFQEQ